MSQWRSAGKNEYRAWHGNRAKMEHHIGMGISQERRRIEQGKSVAQGQSKERGHHRKVRAGKGTRKERHIGNAMLQEMKPENLILFL